MEHGKPASGGDEELNECVRAWIADDPDPASRTELQTLLDRRDFSALRERFDGALEFGTAGLRGGLGAGPARINKAVIARATAGLCAHLLESVPDARARGICIGFDARHQSRALAEETAAVAAGAGFRVRVAERELPTPLLAFAVMHCRAAAGVMITASHNPARDNGYKVYWENGAQIVAPLDAAIARHMRALVSVRTLPRLARPERAKAAVEDVLGAAIEMEYLRGLATRFPSAGPAAAGLRIAYTALHGVGERMARAALGQFGFLLESVPEQADPDPDFPTVPFPNPEEPGAMDRVRALADRIGADLVLANDPDADRLAVAARDASGALRTLTGNEVGALLTAAQLANDRAPGARFVLSSIVSTPMIGAIARAHHAHWEPTLTGFKWICNRALELERTTGARFVFGFEEALGYCIGSLVRDKDGIASAVAVATLAATLHQQGRSLHDALETLFRTHGVHASAQVAIRAEGVDGPQRFADWMQRARSDRPAALAGLVLVAGVDLADGRSWGEPRNHPPLPATNALCWELAGGHRVMLRPSGTEPKLKVYLDVCEAVATGEPLAAARERAGATLAALSDAMRAWLR